MRETKVEFVANPLEKTPWWELHSSGVELKGKMFVDKPKSVMSSSDPMMVWHYSTVVKNGK